MWHMSRKMQNLTHAQELVRLRTGRNLDDLLREMRVDRDMSAVAIAAELGVSRNTVATWLREYGLPTRQEAAA